MSKGEINSAYKEFNDSGSTSINALRTVSWEQLSTTSSERLFSWKKVLNRRLIASLISTQPVSPHKALMIEPNTIVSIGISMRSGFLSSKFVLFNASLSFWQILSSIDNSGFLSSWSLDAGTDALSHDLWELVSKVTWFTALIESILDDNSLFCSANRYVLLKVKIPFLIEPIVSLVCLTFPVIGSFILIFRYIWNKPNVLFSFIRQPCGISGYCDKSGLLIAPPYY